MVKRLPTAKEDIIFYLVTRGTNTHWFWHLEVVKQDKKGKPDNLAFQHILCMQQSDFYEQQEALTANTHSPSEQRKEERALLCLQLYTYADHRILCITISPWPCLMQSADAHYITDQCLMPGLLCDTWRSKEKI